MKITAFSDEQSAGQRLMVGFDGTELNPDLKFLIKTLHVGGIILFTRNLINPDQIKRLCSSIQEYARSCGQPPLFISIDQEGGKVARLNKPFTQFPGNPKMKGPEDAIHFARVTAAELTEIGVNMNLAPVLDVAPQSINSVQASRVFGHDPSWVSELGTVVIDHLQSNNIMAVAKHFPGIGRIILDPHDEISDLDVDADAMQATDLLPFKAAININVAGIMLSHIRYPNMDATWPASLSATIAHDLLRKQMGYGGVIMTDDLDMGAIKKHYNIKSVIQQILSADIDIALICHKGPDIENAFEEILRSLSNSNRIKEKGLQSLKRIMRLKTKYLKF
ncbi:MAG: beta-N-acetylhexosaminidase [Desulfobacterales bacterium]|jgi:beta-N-acetylhexosaminidase